MLSKQQYEILYTISLGKWKNAMSLLEKGGEYNLNFLKQVSPSQYNNIIKEAINKLINIFKSKKQIFIIKAFLDAGLDINNFYQIDEDGNFLNLFDKVLINTNPLNNDVISFEIINLFITKGANTSFLSQVSLIKTIQEGSVHVLSLLLKNGLNPNYEIEDKTLLDFIFDLGFREIFEKVKLLLDYKAALPSLKRFVNISNSQISNILIEKGMSLNGVNLHDTVALSSYKITKALIERGDYINQVDVGGGGCTPLMRAASLGYLKTVYILIHSGADLNITNNDNQSALNLVFNNILSRFPVINPKYELLAIIFELYSNGAIPNLDNEGHTPIERFIDQLTGKSELNSSSIHSKKSTINDYAHKAFLETFELQKRDIINFIKENFVKFEAEYYNLNFYTEDFFSFNSKKVYSYRALKVEPFGYRSKSELTEEQFSKIAQKHLIVALRSDNNLKLKDVIKKYPEIDLYKNLRIQALIEFGYELSSLEQVLTKGLLLNNRIILAAAYNQNLFIEVKEDDSPPYLLLFSSLIKELRTNKQLSHYAETQLIILDCLSQTEIVKDKVLTDEEEVIARELIHELYKANANMNADYKVTHSSGFKDVDELKVTTTIQSWVRRLDAESKPIEIANEDKKTSLSFVQNLLNERAQAKEFVPL